MYPNNTQHRTPHRLPAGVTLNTDYRARMFETAKYRRQSEVERRRSGNDSASVSPQPPPVADASNPPPGWQSRAAVVKQPADPISLASSAEAAALAGLTGLFMAGTGSASPEPDKPTRTAGDVSSATVRGAVPVEPAPYAPAGHLHPSEFDPSCLPQQQQQQLQLHHHHPHQLQQPSPPNFAHPADPNALTTYAQPMYPTNGAGQVLPTFHTVDSSFTPIMGTGRLLYRRDSDLSNTSSVSQSSSTQQAPIVVAMPPRNPNYAYQCRFCSVPFNDLNAREKHEKGVHGPKKQQFACQYCQRPFGTRRNRDRHEKTVHLQQRDHQCSYCEQRFGQKGDRDQHERTVHLGQRDHKCSHCGQLFSRKGHRDQHEKTVHQGQRDFPCRHCHQMFGRKGHRDHHERTVHLQQRKHECNVCRRAFSTKRGCEHHERTAHVYPVHPAMSLPTVAAATTAAVQS